MGFGGVHHSYKEVHLSSFHLQLSSLLYIPMQFSSSSLISTLSLPSTLTPPTSMEDSQLLSSESFSYSLRLSFDAESFIEFDPRLMSMRWSIKAQEGEASESSLDLDSIILPSLSLDSTKSLLSRSSWHQSGCIYAVTSAPVSSGSAQSKSNPTVSKHHRFGLAFQKYLWFVLMKICRRMKLAGRVAGNPSAKAGSIEQGRGNKVFDVDTESSISDAVLHCKNSNLSSLMDEEFKA